MVPPQWGTVWGEELFTEDLSGWLEYLSLVKECSLKAAYYVLYHRDPLQTFSEIVNMMWPSGLYGGHLHVELKALHPVGMGVVHFLKIQKLSNVIKDKFKRAFKNMSKRSQVDSLIEDREDYSM